MFFGAISGSGPATTAAVGMLMIPAMVKRGYDKGYASAITASSGGLGIIIPPSIPYGHFWYLRHWPCSTAGGLSRTWRVPERIHYQTVCGRCRARFSGVLFITVAELSALQKGRV